MQQIYIVYAVYIVQMKATMNLLIGKSGMDHLYTQPYQ